MDLNSNGEFLLWDNSEGDYAELFPFEPLCFSSLRALKKRIKAARPIALVLVIRSGDELVRGGEICDFVRLGMADDITPLVLVLDDDFSVERQSVMQAHGVDEVVALDAQSRILLRTKLTRWLASFNQSTRHLSQSQAQTRLLTSVTRFSQQKEPLASLTQDFMASLTGFCAAHTGLLYLVQQQEWHQFGAPLEASQLQAFEHGLFRQIQAKASAYQTPEIELLASDEDKAGLCSLSGADIGAYLVFPIRIYETDYALALCLITQSAMERVSVKQVDVMKDAARQLKVLMERRVAESKLKVHYLRLKSTLAELSATKEQLIHSEKMASVGQLAAGIAHEINNPLAYVLGNFGPLDEYVDTLVEMLEMHDALMHSLSVDKEGEHRELRQQIQKLKGDENLEFILEDVKAIVNDSRRGLLRVRDIISDLKSFSHRQELETSYFNFKELVDETLRLLKYEVEGLVEVKIDFPSELSLDAHRGFVQQVLTNLVKNASQALEEVVNPSIVLTVVINGDWIDISVTDNGPGIPPDIQSKIFDPFFTTKSVGKGTGLGLSVCYSLAKKMGGELKVESLLGAYTRFTLRLPSMPLV